MFIQTIAFSVYAFYKGYNILGPNEHRIAMISRALLISIGVLTSFLAYYYITLPDLSAIRQSQVIITIFISVFLLRERVTTFRIIAFILTIIAIIVLIRPIHIGSSSSLLSSSSQITNSKNSTTSWIPFSTSWNYLVGIGFALCTAITYSIASVMNKLYFSTQHLHNTVLCFWSALSGLIISIILVCITHFVIHDARSFPHDWRLFTAIALASASIFVFIANQKAIKRERSSIVTIIYSTDIILALILQNLFTSIKTDFIIIIGKQVYILLFFSFKLSIFFFYLGCVLILISILIICIEVLIVERRQDTMAINVLDTVDANENNKNLPKTPTEKRLSI